MDNCVFCSIIAGDIPAKKIYEDEHTYAFYDMNPQAKAHALVIGKKHIDSLAHCDELNDEQLAACLRTCAKVAKLLGIEESGFRVVTNSGANACQSVFHMHFHVLGGQQFGPGMG